MSPAPLRFGVIGCGTIAPTHAEALAALPEDARLVACADIVPDRAEAFAQRFGVRALPVADLLAARDIDAVSICAPSGLHGELGVPALQAGKHVIVEKPFEISLPSCDRLVAAQRASGLSLGVISQHRFDPASVRVRQALDAGELGSLVMVDARIPWYRTQEYYDSGDWRGTWAMDGGGCLMNQGIHTVDLMRWLCGPITSVFARMRSSAAHARIEVEDAVCATLTFANGAIGTVMASTAAYPGFPARLALYGAHGSAVIEGDTLQTLAVRDQQPDAAQSPAHHALQVASGGTQAATAHATPLQASDPSAVWGDAHRAQLLDFVSSCRAGTPPAVDAVQGRAAVEVVLAVYASARTGQGVELPL